MKIRRKTPQVAVYALMDAKGGDLGLAHRPLIGLKLGPSKGLRDFLVIEHLEKPSEN